MIEIKNALEFAVLGQSLDSLEITEKQYFAEKLETVKTDVKYAMADLDYMIKT